MRCIEILFGSRHTDIDGAINSNMRCIEIPEGRTFRTGGTR